MCCLYAIYMLSLCYHFVTYNKYFFDMDNKNQHVQFNQTNLVKGEDKEVLTSSIKVAKGRLRESKIRLSLSINGLQIYY